MVKLSLVSPFLFLQGAIIWFVLWFQSFCFVTVGERLQYTFITYSCSPTSNNPVGCKEVLITAI